MNTKLHVFVAVIIIFCIGGVAVSFLRSDTAANQTGQSVTDEPVATTTVEISTTTAVELNTKDDVEKIVPEIQKKEPVVTELVKEENKTPNNAEQKTPEIQLTTGPREATSDERAKMKAAVNDFLTIMKTGTRDEVKYAMGYNEVTAEEKANFDSLSKDEYEIMIVFMSSIVEDVPHALDTPDEYTTTITKVTGSRYSVQIMDGEREETSSEYYKLYFNTAGEKWVMVNPPQE
jgi:hypothetical protein